MLATEGVAQRQIGPAGDVLTTSMEVGQAVLVTGVGSGPGRAVALAFAAEGASVVATGSHHLRLRQWRRADRLVLGMR